MFKNKYGYPLLDWEGVKVVCLLLGALAVCIYLTYMVIKSIGFTAFAIIVGIQALIILSTFVAALDSPIAYFFKMIALVGFLLFAVGFMISQAGWMVVAIMAMMALPLLAFCVLGMLESPTTEAPKRQEDMFLSPLYKGLSGNIWTRKDE